MVSCTGPILSGAAIDASTTRNVSSLSTSATRRSLVKSQCESPSSRVSVRNQWKYTTVPVPSTVLFSELTVGVVTCPLTIVNG